MKHIHTKTGKSFEVGRLIDFDGKTFDINVITLWDEENDFELSPVIVGYYFGDYDKEVTDDFIDMYLDDQNTLKRTKKYLEDKKMIDGDYMEPEDVEKLVETIESVDNMISKIV